MNLKTWCEKFIMLRGSPISFTDRRYLDAVYGSPSPKIIVRASRQVEKTTYLANKIIHTVIQRPGCHVLYVCPREEQARVFSHSRLIPIIRNSPLINRHLLGKKNRDPRVMHLRFANGSEVYLRAAYLSADSARGIDAEMLVVDEFQDIADGHLPVLEECLSHAQRPQVILAGTPKTIDNHLEGYFRRSTAHEFLVRCASCEKQIQLDARCLGVLGPVCPDCATPLDPREGEWVARNPTSTWGDGYWINHLMVPWVNYAELFDRQRVYDPARFKNECLGLPTTLGDLIVTRAELEACCRPERMASTLRDVPEKYRSRLVAGIDWGGGGRSRTVLVIGYLADDYTFVVVRFERLSSQEDCSLVLSTLADRCHKFRVAVIAGDGGGNGTVFNRLLLEKIKPAVPYYAIIYSVSDHEPVKDGVLWRWTIGRSASLGNVFARVKKKTLSFPNQNESGSYLDEFACVFAEYDSESRSVKYTHPDTQQDDALHATNYALQIAVRHHHGYSPRRTA